MVRNTCLILGFVLAGFLAVSPAFAGGERLSPAVRQAETYLRNLDTARARFLQTAANGQQLVGTFYLDRPGKLRFEYDDPVEDFIVADGFFIYFYDAELEEQSNAPIGQTLADFLLRPDLRLSGDVTVENVQRTDNLLKIRLSETDDPEKGKLVLGFGTEPFQIKKWRVIDATGAITEVELFQLETGMDLAKSLFIYQNPRKFEGNRFND